MPLYTNPDFRRLPKGPAALFAQSAKNSFFALPAWYDLMTRHGVVPGTETRLYTNERPGLGTALSLQVAGQVADAAAERRLTSLVNVYGLEHGIVSGPDADLDSGLAGIVAEILAERPRWDCLVLSEFDPCEPGYRAIVGALRRAGLVVECVFNTGTWYEDTVGLDFADYLAGRPAQLRNTYHRRRRKFERSGRAGKAFFADSSSIEQAISDYETVYAASWKPSEIFPSLIPALIRLAAELGALRLGVYYVDGIPAAAQFWIVWNGRAVIYKLAHDQQFDEFSLGTLLTMEMMERVLTQDRPAEVNFGRGDDPYKQLWLPRRRERWGITAANPRTARGIRLGLWREAAKVYHRLRGERLTPFRGAWRSDSSRGGAMTDGLDGCCAIAVMAKAPVVGDVKTRLTPPLSAAEAAALSGCFIRDIADNIIAASQSAPIHGYVAYAPPGSAPVFRALLPAAIQLLPPRRSGLGHSLAAAARDLLAAGYGSVCLVNSDSPTLPTAFLVEAATALRAPDDRLVLGPAADGGYYCIGLKRPHMRLFEEIAWSTPRVFAQTCDRAREIGLAVALLPPWYDVDDPASLRRLAGEMLGGDRRDSEATPYAASHTAAFLQRLLDDGVDRRLAIDSPGREPDRAGG